MLSACSMHIGMTGRFASDFVRERAARSINDS